MGSSVITDSQAAIGRIMSLQFDAVKGRIEERVVRAASEGEERISWVKGYRGVIGNELAKPQKNSMGRGEDGGQKYCNGCRHQTRVQGNVEDEPSTRMGP